MNKELEDATDRLKHCKTMLYGNDKTLVNVSDLETALKALDNSISKEVIENKIEEYKKEYSKIHAQHYRDCGILENRIQAKILAYQELLEGK